MEAFSGLRNVFLSTNVVERKSSKQNNSLRKGWYSRMTACKMQSVVTFQETPINLLAQEDEMGLPPDYQERRSYPRRIINLPVDFQIIDNAHPEMGLAINVSESGLLIQTFADIRVGTRVYIEVSCGKVAEIPNLIIRSEAEVIWRDICAWEDWETYRYGLKFIQLQTNDCVKLRCLLKNASTKDKEQMRYGPD